MPSSFSAPSCRLLVICLALQVSLAARAAAQDAAGQPSAAGPTNQTQTGKERLGRKWMDEQRIDNCNVPVDKRGSKPRSNACPHVPTSQINHRAAT